MVNTTKPQRQALKRVYDRIVDSQAEKGKRIPRYRDFRKTVAPGYGYIIVPFAGMLLGIEPDGYTHS
jgi:hypothetical protein